MASDDAKERPGVAQEGHDGASGSIPGQKNPVIPSHATESSDGNPASLPTELHRPAPDEASEDGSDWEEESLLEDTMIDVEDEDYGHDSPDRCTLLEARQLRKQLREVGPEEFVKRTLESGVYSPRKLCTAFGVIPPEVLAEADDSVFYTLLGALMSRELSKRHRIGDYSTIDDAAKLLNERNNIIVLTGAGISTNLGIPDFRSKGTGLYARLEHLGLADPQEVFDIELFRESPEIFYSVAKDIVPASSRYSPTHAFIRLLQDKGKLLTNFTQNIDNLEAAAGIVPEKLIQCHGSFATATCQQCSFKCPGDQIATELKAGNVPKCPACIRRIRLLEPLGMKRKRSGESTASKKKRKHDFEDSSESDVDDNMQVAGVMKPDITFFGEDLPKGFHDRLIEHDKSKVDLVIVIGTSLKVAPVADVPDFLPPTIPQLYINRDPVNHIEFDVELLGDCDQIVTELCRRAGWELSHEMVEPGQVLETKPFNEHSESRWRMTPRDGSVTTKKEELDSGTLGHGSAISPSYPVTSKESAKDEDSKASQPKLPTQSKERAETFTIPIDQDKSQQQNSSQTSELITLARSEDIGLS